MASWKETLNLPDTAFPMKADLVRREPEILAKWNAADLYGKVRAARRGAEKYVFHDGPPYANGEGHVGTFRNKILKDVAVRYQTMRGKDAPFIPGWDCHGLPIEHNVMKELGDKGRATPPAEVRRLCRAYAEKYVAIQRDNFARFGVTADWTHPYLTMSPDYEAGILDVFASLAEKGYVARGLRSIHWCVTCRTALAEAELEYAPETSPSIHVRFDMVETDLTLVGGKRTAVVIWTTTPWTLPANVAVAVHPKLQYAVVEHDGPDSDDGRRVARRVVVALDLVTKYLAAVGATDHEIPLVVPGEKLRGAKLRHPFLDRVVPIVTADYVSAEDGTGLVHTAPGHGADDFATGKREGLPILCPVGPDGLYTAEVGVPSLVGTHVFKADAAILALLTERGALAASTKLEHSYPHCWRCHKPVIFRATDQWFVLVDHDGLREKALAACDGVTWIPAWGKARMTGMLKTRPDWCISRQRTWGVPIPAMYCEGCGNVTTGDLHVRLIKHVRDIFAKEGADSWFARDAHELIPSPFVCACGGTRWRKETDIFDVWFESGSSWKSVCTPSRGLDFPADLYLESQDQHRGWFQTSLLPAMAAEGKAPFKTCVTNGFFTDETGDKVSKSKGGMKELTFDVLTKQVGADITRLFFVSGNYFEDIAISRRLFDPAAEQYRKIRNTFRFLLGGVNGFDPAKDALPAEEMLAIDRWAVAAMDQLAFTADDAFKQFDYCKASALLRDFMDGSLSAFYLDLIKDRLYCADATSREGRSVRTALGHLVTSLCGLWAPLLPFTCDEAWSYLPAVSKDVESVHLSTYRLVLNWDNRLLGTVYELRRVGAAVQQHADGMRKRGEVSKGQDVEVTVSASVLAMLNTHLTNEEVAEALGVARVLASTGEASPDTPFVEVRALPQAVIACQRCRRRRPDVAVRTGGRDPLCERCEAWRSQEPPAA